MDDLMSRRNAHAVRSEDPPWNAFARPVHCPDRIPNPQIFYSSSTARCVNKRPFSETNWPARKTWLLVFDLDRTIRINGARDQGTLLSFGPSLDLKLVFISRYFEENSVQFLMITID